MNASEQGDPFSYVPLKRSRLNLKRKTKKCDTNRNSSCTKAAANCPKEGTKKKSDQLSKLLQKSPTSRLNHDTASLPITGGSGTLKLKKRPPPTTTSSTSCRGVCPLCQMPLHLLEGGISAETHIAECAEAGSSLSGGLSACPAGLDCDSGSRAHYRQHSHDELARYRDLGYLDQTTVIVAAAAADGADNRAEEEDGSGKGLAVTMEMTNCSQRYTEYYQRSSSSNLDKTGGKQAEELLPLENHLEPLALPPPADNSTPARRYATISPIRRRRERPRPGRSLLGDGSEVVAANVSVVEPVLGRTEVRHFLNGISSERGEKEKREGMGQEGNGVVAVECDQDSSQSVSLLARGRATGNDLIQADFSRRNTTCDTELERQISRAVETVDRSPDTGEKGGKQQSAGNDVTTPRAGKDFQFPGPSSRHTRTPSGKSTSNQRSTGSLSSGSPFNVRAVKDSEELELSLDLDQEVRYKRIKLQVPLKSRGVPIAVTADYSARCSPSKQARITSFFPPSPEKQKNRRTEGGEGDTAQNNNSTSSSSSTDLGLLLLTKPTNSKSVINSWKEIFKSAAASVAGAAASAAAAAVGGRGSSQTTNTTGNTSPEQARRKCPFYKRISGTNFTVDAFSYGRIGGIRMYFLSHYHYDHYIGISKNWSESIVCSSITSRLLTTFIRVSPRHITVLDPGDVRVIDGVEVSGVDANHCPGSLMFVFRLTSGQTILHTGDFRACPDMESDPIFWNHPQIDTIYLDTTYCKPEYDFPPQDLVIQETVEEVTRVLESFPMAAILVGAYTIGKERIFKGIARGLDCKVWANQQRLKTWSTLQDEEINARITRNRREAQVHVVEAKKINWHHLEQEFASLGAGFDHILGIKPTGWTHRNGLDPGSSLAAIKTVTRGRISLLEVPYSEHSSYSELKRFIQFLRIKSSRQILPTVNLRQRQEMVRHFDCWIQEGRKKGPESQRGPL